MPLAAVLAETHLTLGMGVEARALVDERPAAVVVGEGVVVGHRDYGPVSRVRRLGDGALRVECRGGSFALRPASCSTDVVLAVLRALSSV